MTEIERNEEFRVKLPAFAESVRELHELAKLCFENQDTYLCSRLGTYGDIYNEIKGLCKHYGVEL